MSRGHYIEYYRCGKHVMAQCRCPDKNKAKTVTQKICPQCTDVDTIDMFDGKTERERQNGAEDKATGVWCVKKTTD